MHLPLHLPVCLRAALLSWTAVAHWCAACRWNDNVNPPPALSFTEALGAWQQDVDRGAYAPKLLGSIAAVSSGKVSPARGLRPQGAPGCRSRLSQSAHRPACCSSSGTWISSGTAAHSGDGVEPISSADQRAAITPAVFQGSGEDALLALEALVAQHVVTRPRLTLMQLQRAVQGISRLESPCQLAAIGVLVRGGFWLAAMQVSQNLRLSTLLCGMRGLPAALPTLNNADARPPTVLWAAWHTRHATILACTLHAHQLTALLSQHCGKSVSPANHGCE